MPNCAHKYCKPVYSGSAAAKMLPQKQTAKIKAGKWQKGSFFVLERLLITWDATISREIKYRARI